MSLINDMLRDLDSRNAATSEREGLARNVRALPGAPAQRSVNPVLLALGAALLGGGAVWLLVQAQTPAAPPAVAAAPAAVIEMPAPPMPPVQLEPAPEPSAPASAVPESPALRLETAISKPPAKAEAVASIPPPPPAPVAATPAPTALIAAAAPKATSTTVLPPVPRSNASPHISKQPTDGSTASEQADAEYRRGINAIRRGDAVEGGEALRTALRIAPGHAAARQALLAQLTEQQRWTDVETLALDGIGLMPQRSDWALLAARLMYERGDPSSALTVLDQYAANARQNADYQILRALLLQRAGRNADAAECYQVALALRPQEGRWWYGLGRALDADHREGLARQAYEKARETGNLPPDLQQAVERRLR